MIFECDQCHAKLGETAYTDRGYNLIACSPGCLALLRLDIRKINTEKFFEENR